MKQLSRSCCCLTVALITVIPQLLVSSLNPFKVAERVANGSILLSTGRQVMLEDGKPVSHFARRIGADSLADSRTLQVVEWIGMNLAARVPPVQATRIVYQGARSVARSLGDLVERHTSSSSSR